MPFILLNVFICLYVLWPRMRALLVNVPCEFEENVHFAVVLHVSIYSAG